MAKGKKNCPNCNIEFGARTLKCNKCGYIFMSILEKEKKSKQKKKIIENEDHIERKGIIFSSKNEEEIVYGNKKINAKRILSYGKERARSLLFIAQKTHCWKHVDWDYVAKKI